MSEHYETIRDAAERREKATLSEYACLSENTKGREHGSHYDSIRTEFQRDRDKIIHCQSFRRLMNKTQVFLAPAGDHYRTRLTHTLEVSQIGRTIARSLSLNEDLVEAASLGHDLGHTPFGHAGESMMQKCFSADFTHSRQSLRVVEKLERGGKGLNLTYEVRDAIVNHSGSDRASTLEGLIIRYADRIAYINHDIDDACRAGILSPDDIPKELCDVLGHTHSERINTMVRSVVVASEGKNDIAMEPHVQEATDNLRAFLFENVYRNPIAKAEDNKAKALIERLFEYYVKHPDMLSGVYKAELETETPERCVCDFISGMTDRYAIETYNTLFIPDLWRGLS